MAEEQYIQSKIKSFDTEKSSHHNYEKMCQKKINEGPVYIDTAKANLEQMAEVNRENTACEVSVIVLCYAPRPEALFFTLDSVVAQQNTDFEIVISDDGSEDNLYEPIKNYFTGKNFNRWKFVYSESNHGTVCNLYNGLSASEGIYVKDIAPGDALSGNNILREWVDFLKKNECRWSFSDALYYKRSREGNLEYIRGMAHPYDIKPYLKKDMAACRWNFVALNDVALGAAMLSERTLLVEYCSRILNRVKYAEDNIFRMMMFDNIVGYYFPRNAVIYEYGTGISTNKNDVWERRIMDDYKVANAVMIENGNINTFQKSILKAMEADTAMKKILIKGKLLMSLKNKVGLYRRTGKVEN